MYRIHSINTDNNLVEINEEISELLDKQLWLPMNKGLIAKVGGNQKCAMKIKKKNEMPVKKIFNDGSDFFRMLHNSRSTDEDETNNNETT